MFVFFPFNCNDYNTGQAGLGEKNTKLEHIIHPH